VQPAQAETRTCADILDLHENGADASIEVGHGGGVSGVDLDVAPRDLPLGASPKKRAFPHLEIRLEVLRGHK
jgi:hypothetical protein